MADRTETTQDIAELFDVDTSTIHAWVKDGCPCDPSTSKRQSHKFNAGEVVKWMQDNNRTGKKGRPSTPEGDELQAAKLRKEIAMAEKYERENAVAAGKLIDAATEQARDVQKITAIRNRLCGLGASLAGVLEGKSGAERQSLIDDSIQEILAEFARGYE